MSQADKSTQGWHRLQPWQLPLISIIILSLLWLLLFTQDGWVPVLDSANLAFHEAGHVFFGFLGSTMGLYGGTLGQLVFPVVISIRFWRRGDSFAFSLGLIWLFENLINIARYMGDARDQLLPLVGGGEHDWTNILSRWGMLEADQSLAGLLRSVAVIGMLATWGWLFLKSRNPEADS